MPEETSAFCSAAASFLLVKAMQPMAAGHEPHVGVWICPKGGEPCSAGEPYGAAHPQASASSASFITGLTHSCCLPEAHTHTQQAVVLPHSAMRSNWQYCSPQTQSPFCLLAGGEAHWDSMSVVLQEIDGLTIMKLRDFYRCPNWNISCMINESLFVTQTLPGSRVYVLCLAQLCATISMHI